MPSIEIVGRRPSTRCGMTGLGSPSGEMPVDAANERPGRRWLDSPWPGAPYAATVRSSATPITTSHPVRRHAGITCAKLWIWPSREEVCMTDAAPEPAGSGEEIKRKFREALERKRAEHADANAARGGKDAGKVHGARGLA